LRAGLKTGIVGRELTCLDSTTSTQDVARELADKGSPDGTVVMALSQQAGRGRLGRSWFSPEGTLAASIVLKPPLRLLRLLPAISSLAVLRALKTFRIQAAIKWPNDVMIRGKKVCGILIENAFTAGKYDFSVVGIGINVNFDTGRYPEIAEIATSLSTELKREVLVSRVALHLFTELDKLYTRIHNSESIFREWARQMETLGHTIAVKSGEETIYGMAERLTPEGNLLLRLADGSTREVVAGDVTVLKESTNK